MVIVEVWECGKRISVFHISMPSLVKSWKKIPLS
jgi:hypothetical protein